MGEKPPKPPEIKEDAIRAAKGDEKARERLSAAGKKGARVRMENKEWREAGLEKDWEEVYEQERSRLETVYPERDEEGNDVTEEWYDAQAREFADALIAMKMRQAKLLGK